MKKLLLPLAMIALFAVPATASADQCRNAKGQFAKCGTPGAIPASQYKAKGKAPAAPAMAPAMKPAKPFGGQFAPKPKPAAPAMAPAMKPAAAPAVKAAPVKAGPCKDPKGKFIKCPK